MYVLSLLIPKNGARATVTAPRCWLNDAPVVLPDVPHFADLSGFSRASRRGMLHSNPMDYAWGANGLDAIITQVRRREERVSFTPQWRTAQWCAGL